MRSRSIRFRMVLTLLSLLPALFAVQAVAAPGTADARCVGSSPIISRLILNGWTAVTESPVNTTCNGDRHYAADFRNHYNGTTVWRASVWIRDLGTWRAYYGGRWSGWNSYSFSDTDSRTWITLCVDNGSTTYCGWGSNYKSASYPTYDRTYYGVNSGF